MNAADLLLGPAALARHAERTALICGAQRLTYAQFADHVARSAGALAELGVRPGERVLFLMRDTPQFAAAWLGAVHAGAVAIALNNKLSNAELRHVVADCQPRTAIVDDSLATRLSDVPVVPAALWEKKTVAAAAVPACQVDPEDSAFLLYSSGTTGRPKGIVHVHRGFRSLGLAFRLAGIGAGDRVFTTSKFFFAYGLEHGLLATLALGATSIIYPDWPDSEAVVDLVERHRPTALFSVPSIYRRLLGEPSDRLAAFRAVRQFVAGGERMSAQLVRQWRNAVDGELLNLYGMSETFCACMMTPSGTSDGLRTGRALEGVQVRLLSATGEEAGAHEPGVLWVRHPAQASGYLNLPEQTRQLFRDGWFCSRDIFVRDEEGYFVHQGRSDEMLKVSGQWVQPGELEEVAALEPAIAEAACVPVADADGLERLALFVMPRADKAEAENAAIAACERLLPRHKRPRWVRALTEFPRTATGKVQRFKLREILERELALRD